MTFSHIWARRDHAAIEGCVLLFTLAMHSLHISLHGRLPNIHFVLFIFFVFVAFHIYHAHPLYFAASPVCSIINYQYFRGEAHARWSSCVRECACERVRACVHDSENFFFYFKCV